MTNIASPVAKTPVAKAPVFKAPVSSDRSTFLKVLRAAGAAIRRVVTAWSNRRDVRLLAEMDDRSLKDIGLVRTDVYGALDAPFHRDPSTLLVIRSTERRAMAHEIARDGLRRPLLKAARPDASAQPEDEAPSSPARAVSACG